MKYFKKNTLKKNKTVILIAIFLLISLTAISLINNQANKNINKQQAYSAGISAAPSLVPSFVCGGSGNCVPSGISPTIFGGTTPSSAPSIPQLSGVPNTLPSSMPTPSTAPCNTVNSQAFPGLGIFGSRGFHSGLFGSNFFGFNFNFGSNRRERGGGDGGSGSGGGGLFGNLLNEIINLLKQLLQQLGGGNGTTPITNPGNPTPSGSPLAPCPSQSVPAPSQAVPSQPAPSQVMPSQTQTNPSQAAPSQALPSQAAPSQPQPSQ